MLRYTHDVLSVYKRQSARCILIVINVFDVLAKFVVNRLKERCGTLLTFAAEIVCYSSLSVN